jgi:hypothetical protein
MAAKDKKLHVITEVMGVLAGIALIFFSTQVDDPISNYLLIMGVATIVIDAWFLTTWA